MQIATVPALTTLDKAGLPNRSALLNEACDLLLARDGAEALRNFDGIFFVYAGERVQTQRGCSKNGC